MFGLFKRGIEQYERDLTSLSPKKREKAARNLGKLKDERAVSLLAGALQDHTAEVRKAAARALGSLGDTNVTASLLRVLEDQEDSVRLAAGASLVHLGEWRGLEPLLRLLDDPTVEDPVRTVAVEILETNHGIDLLIRAIREHPDAEVSRLAALVLTCAAPDDARATEALVQAQAAGATSIKELEGQGHKQAFCLKCGSNRDIRNPQRVTFMSGTPGTIGQCSDCGKTVLRLGGG
ncbi:MAG: HEAT repeat domain-containing protein [Dehalococcoidia bacterium]